MALSELEKRRRRRRSAHNTHLKRTYGITIDEYDLILAAQGGKCRICGGGTTKRHFAVDHNHKTRKVRGLLCARCNSGLAKFMDSLENVERAVAYLRLDGHVVDELLGRNHKTPEENK